MESERVKSDNQLSAQVRVKSNEDVKSLGKEGSEGVSCKKGLLNVWAVWYVIAIVMSVVQSCIFIKDYLKFEVTEETLVENQARFELPAITICTGALIAPGKGKGQYDAMKSFSELLNELAQITNTERYALGHETNDFVMKCSFNQDKHFIDKQCWDSSNPQSEKNKLAVSFNNLYYGNCVTFNTIRYEQKLSDGHSVLPTEINLVLNTRYMEKEPMWSKGPIVIFHESETEPIFDAKNINYIDTTADSVILVTKRDFTRIPWPYESQCVINDNKPFRTTGKGERPHYSYSIEACITRCLQNLTVTYCKCRLPYFHSNKTLPVCGGCKNIPQSEVEDMCSCKHACKYSEYDLTLKPIRNKLSNVETSRSIVSGGNAYYFNATKDENRDEIQLKIMVATTSVKYVRELLYYHVAYMLSDIGGIFGLWIGISIMTIFEFLYELLNMGRKHIMKITGSSVGTKDVESENKPAGDTDSIGSDSSKKRLVESSIPMVQRIQYSANCFGRVCWACLFIIGIFFATGQVYRLSKLYHEFRVLENVDDKVRMDVFPAVTVCSNVLVWSVEDIAETDRKTLLNMTTSTQALNNYLAHKSNDFRLKVGVPMKKFIKQCQHETGGRKYSCKNLPEMNIPKFGNCVTYNAGLLNNDVDDELPTELNMRLQYVNSPIMKETEYYNKGVYVHLHARGTSPFLHPKEWLFIRPGEYFNIKFKTTLYERLPDPYINHCVSEYSPEYQWKNLFHTHDKMYKHTTKSCTESCQFNLTLAVTDCMNLVNAEFKGRLELDDDTQAREFYSTCTAIPQNLSETVCDCRLPCSNMEHKPKARKITEAMFLSTLSIGAVGEVQSHEMNSTDPPASGFILMPDSPYITVSSEEPHLYLADLCCAIGGTLGMWVGISILSVIELKVFIFLKLLGKTE
ncbi:hypothetical protein CHUAL_011872 [Chamberlinius hualienensis]